MTNHKSLITAISNKSNFSCRNHAIYLFSPMTKFQKPEVCDTSLTSKISSVRLFDAKLMAHTQIVGQLTSILWKRIINWPSRSELICSLVVCILSFIHLMTTLWNNFMPSSLCFVSLYDSTHMLNCIDSFDHCFRFCPLVRNTNQYRTNISKDI